MRRDSQGPANGIAAVTGIPGVDLAVALRTAGFAPAFGRMVCRFAAT
jgi:hypothetical protein